MFLVHVVHHSDEPIIRSSAARSHNDIRACDGTGVAQRIIALVAAAPSKTPAVAKSKLVRVNAEGLALMHQ